jgi:hypothetical protein
VQPHLLLLATMLAIAASNSASATPSISCTAPSGKVPSPITVCRAATNLRWTPSCDTQDEGARSTPEEIKKGLEYLLLPRFGTDTKRITDKLWGALGGATLLGIDQLVERLERARARAILEAPELNFVKFVSIAPNQLGRLLSEKTLQAVPILVLRGSDIYIVAEWEWTVVRGAYFTPTDARISRWVCPIDRSARTGSVRLGADESILAIMSIEQ